MQKSELDINVLAAKAGGVDFVNGHSSPPGPGNGRVTSLPCPHCSCPGAQELLSRHPVADGLLTYTRCRCGALHLWLSPRDTASARHITQGRRYR